MPRLEENESYNLTTCMTHVVLAGSAAFALNKTSCYDTPYAFATFGFVFAHSIIGIFNFGARAEYEDIDMQCLFDYTSLQAIVFPLPMLATEMSMLNEVPIMYAVLPFTASIAPLIVGFWRPCCQHTVVDSVVALSFFSAVCVANYYEGTACAWGLIALAAQNHYIFRKLTKIDPQPVCDEIVAMGLAFFCVVTANCFEEIMS